MSVPGALVSGQAASNKINRIPLSWLLLKALDGNSTFDSMCPEKVQREMGWRLGMEEPCEVKPGQAPQISAKGPEFPREKPALRVRRALPIVPTGLWAYLSSALDQERPERGTPS